MTKTNSTFCLMHDSTHNLYIKTTQNETEPAPFYISPSGIKTLPMQPSFSAYLDRFVTTSQSKANPLADLNFDHIDSNKGDYYNPQRGEFTAPKGGIYLFNVAARLTMIPESVSPLTLRLIAGNQSFDTTQVVDRNQNHIRSISIMQAVMMVAEEVAKVVIESDYPVNLLSLDGRGTIPRTFFQGRLLG